MGFDHGEKIQTSYYFSKLYLYFQDFFQVWKIAGQISRLFQEFKTVWTLVYFQIAPPFPLAERDMASLGTCQQHGGNRHHSLHLPSN